MSINYTTSISIRVIARFKLSRSQQQKGWFELQVSSVCRRTSWRRRPRPRPRSRRRRAGVESWALGRHQGRLPLRRAHHPQDQRRSRPRGASTRLALWPLIIIIDMVWSLDWATLTIANPLHSCPWYLPDYIWHHTQATCIPIWPVLHRPRRPRRIRTTRSVQNRPSRENPRPVTRSWPWWRTSGRNWRQGLSCFLHHLCSNHRLVTRYSLALSRLGRHSIHLVDPSPINTWIGDCSERREEHPGLRNSLSVNSVIGSLRNRTICWFMKGRIRMRDRTLVTFAARLLEGRITFEIIGKVFLLVCYVCFFFFFC